MLFRPAHLSEPTVSHPIAWKTRSGSGGPLTAFRGTVQPWERRRRNSLASPQWWNSGRKPSFVCRRPPRAMWWTVLQSRLNCRHHCFGGGVKLGHISNPLSYLEPYLASDPRSDLNLTEKVQHTYLPTNPPISLPTPTDQPVCLPACLPTTNLPTYTHAHVRAQTCKHIYMQNFLCSKSHCTSAGPLSSCIAKRNRHQGSIHSHPPTVEGGPGHGVASVGHAPRRGTGSRYISVRRCWPPPVWCHNLSCGVTMGWLAAKPSLSMAVEDLGGGGFELTGADWRHPGSKVKSKGFF